MNPSLWWDYWDDWRHLRAWISEILDKVAHIRTSLSWQTTEVNEATAMAEDGERPEEKPRPPAGGQSSFPFQTRISSDTGGFKAQ